MLGRGFARVRTPSRVDRDIREPNSGTPVLAGDPFRLRKVIAYELGYRAQLTRKVSTSISTFYNEYDDVRSLSSTPVTTVPLFFANNLEGHTYGGEISADYQMFDWWRLHAATICLKIYSRQPGQTDIDNGRNERPI